MTGPIPMMVWELWRTSRFELLLRLAGQSAFVTFIHLVSPFSGDAQNQVLRGIAVGVLLVTSFFSQSWLSEFDSKSRGFSFQLGFARPVPTLTLFFLPMLFCVSSSLLIYAVPAALLSWLQQKPVAIAEPLFMIATGIIVGVSVVWAIPRRSEKLMMASSVTAILVAWCTFASPPKDAQPLLFRLGTPDFFNIQPLHYVSAIALVVVALLLSLHSVDLQRHGEHPSLLEWLSRCFGSAATRPLRAAKDKRPFTRRITAQLWYEWRRSGRTVVALSIAAALLLLSLLLSIPLANPHWRFDARIWLGALIVCPLVYQMVGVDGVIGLKQIQGSTKLSTFDATRSLRNDQLVSIKLLMVSACSFLGWLCMLLAAVVHTLLRGSWNDWLMIGQSLMRTVDALSWTWSIAALVNGALCFVTGSATLLAFFMYVPHHHRLAFGGMLFVTLNVIALAADANHGWTFHDAWIVYAWMLAAVIVVGSALLIRKAIVTRSISPTLLLVTFAMWSFYAISVVASLYKASFHVSLPVPVALIVPTCSLLLVPLVSIVAAPLALASWRHR